MLDQSLISETTMKFIIVFAFFSTFVAGAKANEDGRIIGGSEAAIGEFPWIVSISEDFRHFCSGFIYNDRYVVTAASCLDGKTDLTKLGLKAGAVSINSPGSYDQQLGVFSIKLHPSYNPSNKQNDIALVLTDRPFIFNEYVKAIRYDEIDDKVTTARIAGWGVTYEGGPDVLGLKVATVSELKANCKTYGSDQYTPNYMICAGDGSNSPCNFDEGSPLVQSTSTGNIVVGIMSKNKGCDTPYAPSIYTRLTAYYAWFSQNAGQQPANLN